MLVVLWNVANGGDRRLPLLERVDADLLLINGVSRASARKWTRRWEGRYHCEAALALTDSPQKRPHGSMIASRWPLKNVRVLDWLPRPERVLVAVAEHPDGPLTLISWGAPNAAGDGRAAKEDAYAHMTREVEELGRPLILGADTNTWADPPLGGSQPEPSTNQPAERRFLGRRAPHGLLDVHRHLVDSDPERSRVLAAVRPFGPLATTYVRRPRGEPRRIVPRSSEAFGLDRMDRLYVSPEIVPLACEHFFHDAIDAGSDHAMVVTSLALPPAAPGDASSKSS